MTVIPLGRTATAVVERDRVAKLLAAIEEVKEARAKARAEGQTETAEYLALQALTAAEEHLQGLVLDPGLHQLLSHVLVSLSEFAGSAA